MKILVINNGIIHILKDGDLKEIENTNKRPEIEILIYIQRDKKYCGKTILNEFEFNQRVYRENRLYPYCFDIVQKVLSDYNLTLNKYELEILESTKNVYIK